MITNAIHNWPKGIVKLTGTAYRTSVASFGTILDHVEDATYVWFSQNWPSVGGGEYRPIRTRFQFSTKTWYTTDNHSYRRFYWTYLDAGVIKSSGTTNEGDGSTIYGLWNNSSQDLSTYFIGRPSDTKGVFPALGSGISYKVGGSVYNCPGLGGGWRAIKDVGNYMYILEGAYIRKLDATTLSAITISSSYSISGTVLAFTSDANYLYVITQISTTAIRMYRFTIATDTIETICDQNIPSGSLALPYSGYQERKNIIDSEHIYIQKHLSVASNFLYRYSISQNKFEKVYIVNSTYPTSGYGLVAFTKVGTELYAFGYSLTNPCYLIAYLLT